MACDCCCISAIVYGVGIITIAKFVVPFILKLVKKDNKDEIIEKDWKKDVVYLFQFDGTPTMSSLSPFCTKVEAFLRIQKIKFERRNTTSTRGQNGKLPLVELNGEQISDSQIILMRLAQKFDLKENVSEEKSAVGHAIGRLIDNHTFYHLIHFKAQNIEKMIEAFPKMGPQFLKPLLVLIGSFVFRRMICSRVEGSVGKFTEEEYEELLRNDMLQIQKILGNNKFLLGDSPTAADCSLFGQITSVYNLDPSNSSWVPAKLINSAEFFKFKAWIERFRDTVFGSEFHA